MCGTRAQPIGTTPVETVRCVLCLGRDMFGVGCRGIKVHGSAMVLSGSHRFIGCLLDTCELPLKDQEKQEFNCENDDSSRQ